MYFGLIKYMLIHLYVAVYTLYEMNVFVCVCLIQKPIETFYENCLSFMFACQHLIQY